MAVWAGFLTLGLIWGSSFLLIKVGVAELTPLQLVGLRIGTAAVAMLLTLYLTGHRFPRDRASVGGLVVAGLFNTAVPFFLITWGEQSIASGLATVLNATVPLFSLVIAHFALQDERITGMKVLGLVSGFVGIIVLASRSLGQEEVTGSLAGQGAVLLAALCYAGTTVFVRRNLRHLQPLVVSSGALLTGRWRRGWARCWWTARRTWGRSLKRRRWPCWGWGWSTRTSPTCCSTGSSTGGGPHGPRW